MPRILTHEELQQKFRELKIGTIPALVNAMEKAALNVEAQARKNCTIGHSPYYKAPYSDDNDPRREPPHMRDTIQGNVREVSGDRVMGVVWTPKDYAFFVHEGTSRMQARPFIMDAIKSEDKTTRTILSKAIYDHIRSQCV